MSLRSFFADLFGRTHAEPGASLSRDNSRGMDINPATGLPMLDDAVDVAGNPYGTRRHRPEEDTTAASWSGPEHHHDDHRAIGGLDDYGSSTGTDRSGASPSTYDPWSDHSSYAGGYDPSRDW